MAPLIAAWDRGEVDAVTVSSSASLDNLITLLGVPPLAAQPVFVHHPRLSRRAPGRGRCGRGNRRGAGGILPLPQYGRQPGTEAGTAAGAGTSPAAQVADQLAIALRHSPCRRARHGVLARSA